MGIKIQARFHRSNPYIHRSGNRVRSYVPTTRGRNYMTIRVAQTL
jgi:hypothetical protein